MQIQSVAVFCGSKLGNDKAFELETKELGELLGLHKIKLIYGGGNKGLMGTVANAALKQNGEVIGVIPKVLVEWEQQHNGITELIVVNDMHERKKLMYQLSDAAIILPGGNGTMDEMFEMLTWNTLQIHNKKIFILNINGYYNHLVEFIKTMFKSDFLYEPWEERITVFPSVKSIFDFLALNKK
jgi:uncharacterized protein (TIGR00730 family)